MEMEKMPLERNKKCSECGEIKPLSCYPVTESGLRHEPYCNDCAMGLVAPKKTPKILGKKRPIPGFCNADLIKKYDESIGKTVGEALGKVEIKQGKIMKVKPTKKEDKTMDESLRVEMEAKEYFENTITPYVKLKGNNGFLTKDLDQYMGEDHGKSRQWILAMVRKLVFLNILRVKKVKGYPNKYFIKEEPGTKRKHYTVDEVMGEKKVKETTPQKPLKAVMDVGKIEVRENLEGKKVGLFVGDKMVKKTKEISIDDDFIREVSKIADQVCISFVERETKVVISPSGNILRIYDLLTSKQKKTAEVEGKTIKFRW